MFPHRYFRLAVLCSFAFTFLAAPGFLPAQGIPIPVKASRDMVFDFAGQRLYISTSDGFIQRYNVSTGQLETPFNVGGSLNGIDIARDNSFLLVAQNAVGVTQGTVHKVNSSTGAVININYTRSFSESGAWDVAIASNGLAFVTTNFEGSGWTPLHQINLATNAITVRSDAPGSGGDGEVRGSSAIHRSADGTRLYFLEGDISSGPVFTYSAVSDTFGPNAETNSFGSRGAVNRNGTLVGTLLFSSGASIDTAPAFNYVHNFNAADGAVAFDAQTDTFYAVNTSANQIIAYDTNTFAEKFRLDIGDEVQFGGGELVASPDGIHLALQTDSGIRLYDVRQGTPALPPVFGTPRDMVFDHAGQRLYISTAEGLVWPYNLSTNTFGTPFNFGGSPYGLDITADDSVLLVAQGTGGLTQSAYQKRTLATGAMTNIVYTRPFSGGSPLDVAVASNGLALGTSNIVHQINPTTNAISERTDSPADGFSSLLVHRSADRTLLYFLDGNFVFLYHAPTDTFDPAVQTQSSIGGASAAVNRNGTLLGTGLSSGGASLDTAPGFNFVHNFNTLDSGIAFDAVQDTFYGVNSLRNQIIAYNTTTFAEKFRFDIGENVDAGATFFGPGNLVASQDGHYLALITPTTMRVFVVPTVPLAFVSSRKTHGSAGVFDINMPLDGNPGVECRSGGANGQFTMVFTFGVNLTSVGGASVTDGTGMVSSGNINPSNVRQYIVNLTGVTDSQYIKVTLTNVNDVAAHHTDAISGEMGILLGDTNGSHSVNSTDVTQTKGQSGHVVTNSNFRQDPNATGSINASDISLVKVNSGHALPETFSQTHAHSAAKTR